MAERRNSPSDQELDEIADADLEGDDLDRCDSCGRYAPIVQSVPLDPAWRRRGSGPYGLFFRTCIDCTRPAAARDNVVPARKRSA